MLEKIKAALKGRAAYVADLSTLYYGIKIPPVEIVTVVVPVFPTVTGMEENKYVAMLNVQV